MILPPSQAKRIPTDACCNALGPGALSTTSSATIHRTYLTRLALDKPLSEGAINLTHAGLQRHRVMWIREMSEEETRQVGETGPTIDSIEMEEFESHAELKKWLKQRAPAFLP
jgi:hypothetical protein